MFLRAFALGMFVAALMLISVAHAYSKDDYPRPKPRPLMDCWVTEDGGVDCEFREDRT